MKILITGGAGFIGSHLADKLIQKGNQVVIVDNLSTGRSENLNKKAKFYKTDICSPKIRQIFEKEKPKTVFHYAARADVSESIKNPINSANVNILGTLNILENCVNFKTKKFIFASSVGVYGEPKNLPVKEEHPLDPISPYSMTKMIVGKYLQYYQKKGLKSVSLRYSNIYGPRQNGSNEGGVVAIFITQILKGKKPVIFGSGFQTRDFLYVDDAVEAAIKALKAENGSVYNVGTNREITIKYLLKTICDNLDKEFDPIFKAERPGEIMRSRTNFSKIKKELGWQSGCSLKQGLEQTIKWFEIKK